MAEHSKIEWRPISTAPKDGQPVRLADTYGDGRLYPLPHLYCWTPEFGWAGYASRSGGRAVISMPLDPTHWRPVNA